VRRLAAVARVLIATLAAPTLAQAQERLTVSPGSVGVGQPLTIRGYSDKGAGVYRVGWRKGGRSLGPRLSFQRPTLKVTPRRVRRGGFVRVHGGVSGCQGPVTLISRAFSRRHQFAGVPAISAPVGAHGAYSVRTRIPARRSPGVYPISGRCGGGNLGVQARLRVLR
jgi:hypothetical protein